MHWRLLSARLWWVLRPRGGEIPWMGATVLPHQYEEIGAASTVIERALHNDALTVTCFPMIRRGPGWRR